MNERYWKALPGARHIQNVDTLISNDWIDITSIEVHPLYEGYCNYHHEKNTCSSKCKNSACANNKYIYKMTAFLSNKILNRKEHNVAVLQMKTSLQFSHNSPYSPICLPKSCLEICETWGEKTEQELLGTDAYSKKFQDGTTQNLAIIDNAECTEELNNWAARKVKRLIFHISYFILMKASTFNLLLSNLFVFVFSDHLCAEFGDETGRECHLIDIGSPLFIKEIDNRGYAR